MAEGEQTIDLVNIGNNENNIEENIEETNDDAKAEEERLAAAKAEEISTRPSNKDEKFTYERLMEIKHKGSQISEREKQRILNNLSSVSSHIHQFCTLFSSLNVLIGSSVIASIVYHPLTSSFLLLIWIILLEIGFNTDLFQA